MNKSSSAYTDSSLKMYLREMAQYPMLSEEEEYEITGLAAEGNEEARKKLINANLRLVVSLSGHYKGCGLPMQDLIQEGNIGLMKAVEKFDREKGYKFSTYASWWIKQSIVKALTENSKAIRLPSNVYAEVNKLRSVSRDLANKLDREPTNAELAEEMKISEAKITQLMSYMAEPTSLDMPIGEEDEGATVGALIEDTKFVSPEVSYMNESNKDIIDSVLDTLDQREGDIIRYRFGLKDGKIRTLEEVGKIFDISKERIRQIEIKALRKLRHPSRAAVLRECCEH